MTVQLRGYLPGDLDALYALDVVCFDALFRFSRSAMRRFAESARARVTVATTDGNSADNIVGFGILHLPRSRAESSGYLVTLDVDPRFRRQGVAGAILAGLAQQAEDAGCTALSLHAAVGNAPAIRFYERHGFQRLCREFSFYGAGGDAWLYAKPIAPKS